MYEQRTMAHHVPEEVCVIHHYPTPSQKFLTVIISIVVITIATLPDNKSVLGEQNGTEQKKIHQEYQELVTVLPLN